MKRVSKALGEYLDAFAASGEPFLDYYSFGPNASGPPRHECFTRGEFWSLARRSAHVLRASGLARGDSFANLLSGNRPGDLAFRLAAAMVGAVPVTINWQADTPEVVEYKIGLTGCRLVLTDGGTAKESVDALKGRLPGLAFFCIDELPSQPELPEEDFCAELDPDATRIIIFTSSPSRRKVSAISTPI